MHQACLVTEHDEASTAPAAGSTARMRRLALSELGLVGARRGALGRTSPSGVARGEGERGGEWREMEIRGSMFAVRRSPEGPEADFETSLIFPRRHSRRREGGGGGC